RTRQPHPPHLPPQLRLPHRRTADRPHPPLLRTDHRPATHMKGRRPKQQTAEKMRRPDRESAWAEELIDLSRPITLETGYALWGDMLDDNPQVRDITVDYVSQFPKDNGTICRFTICDHTATHVDSPIHTVRGGSPLELVDISRLIGEAVVLDMLKGHL